MPEPAAHLWRFRSKFRRSASSVDAKDRDVRTSLELAGVNDQAQPPRAGAATSVEASSVDIALFATRRKTGERLKY